MLPFAAGTPTSADPSGFSFMGLHGTFGLLLAIGMGAVTLVAIFKTGIVPLMRFVARGVEALEVILGSGNNDGLVARLDRADEDRNIQVRAIDDIHSIVKRAGLLNGNGERLVSDVGGLKELAVTVAASQEELRRALAQHISDESMRTAALWAAILEAKERA